MYSDFRALDPSKYLDKVSPGRTATVVVAAANASLQSRAQADYVCDGVNDHVEIQAAIDALPATGGEVRLLDGTYNIEVSLVLDSYQTLRGCGRSTILTTTTAALDIITATGSSGNEKVGILIADLCVDGSAGGAANGTGIVLTYVDYSKVRDVWCQNMGVDGIDLYYCDFNEITGVTFQGISIDCIYPDTSNYNTISGNNCSHSGTGIDLYESNSNIISNNNCQGNSTWGIYLSASSNNNIVSNNNCQWNGHHGISLESSNSNIISDNNCRGNSQMQDNNRDNIYINTSDYNLIANNLCRAPTIGTTLTVGEPIGETEIAVTNVAGFEVGMGVVIDLGGVNEEYHRISAISGGAPGVIIIDAGLTNAQGAGETIDVPEARYGINIPVAASGNNVVKGNDLHDGGKTAALNDAGTNTIFDQVMHSIALNLTGGATDIEVFFAKCPCILAGYSVLYSIATGGGAGVNIRVGRYQDGVALDDDYFDVSVSELNEAKGYSKHFDSADLTQTVIATGDTITVGTAGGKVDTGEIIVVLEIAEMAS